MTPSEIIKAENHGATIVKLFPGNILGPGFVTAVKELFPNLLFMPTGGVDLSEENLRSWFSAGVCAVGMGSKLISKSLLEKQDYQTIQELTKQALQLIKTLKKPS
jgi:2-dehydro-3-deoxyphosphogluconate aldolase/(4S)-4-hydroxy-2-oxoglutarate aldolase